ncbi:hypothetical protein [Halanaerobium salsuginis]|jgi:hypothetical protein|uniref:DUF5723 domain-containing protein n=1 Tax=Halanaerobium salsuginis TaxID=29563 RepID=A0A1I4H7H5_9FIRM|nr:hypothetical protein [Halanaerobium salsuginis]SFL38262.1 hypothetical protein SAMN02983006_00999 [Halanaerobium salsuginis]
MNKKTLHILLLFLCLIMLATQSSLAALDAEAIGIGADFSTLTGESAYYSNPAGLSLRDNNFTIKANFGFSIWNNVFKNDEFSDEDFTAKLSDEDLLVGGMAAAGTQIFYKNFTIGINARGEGILTADSDAAGIIAGDEPEIEFESGTDSASVTADLGQTAGGAVNLTDLSLSYAREIGTAMTAKSELVEALYFGATYHYLEGDIYSYSGGGNITATLLPDGTVTYSSTSSPEFYADRNDSEATGNAFDLGLLFKLRNNYSLAFSVMNIGKLTADDYYRDGVRYTIVSSSTKLEEEDFEGTVIEDELEYDLPRIVRLGLKLDYSPNTVFYADYERINYDGGQDENIYSLGSQFRKTKLIPLRLGINYSTLRESVELAAGLGININNSFKIDFGIADLLALTDNAKGVKFGLATTIKF